MGGQLPVLPLLLNLCSGWQQLVVQYYCLISHNQLLNATTHLVYGLARLESYKGNVCDL